MTDDLSEFLDTEEGWSESGEAFAAAFLRDVFVFEYASSKYAVSAAQVAGVIPWRRPVPLPRSDPRVRGVIQDRGHIVVVMQQPTGQPQTGEEADRSGKTLSESLKAALPDIALLLIINVLVFMCAYIAFLRYDVRQR